MGPKGLIVTNGINLYRLMALAQAGTIVEALVTNLGRVAANLPIGVTNLGRLAMNLEAFVTNLERLTMNVEAFVTNLGRCLANHQG